jgi:CheY-like chemotaxis protein
VTRPTKLLTFRTSDLWGYTSPSFLLLTTKLLIRNLVTLLLQHEGYFVISAADGHEGLELSRKYPGVIDLLITDINMPRMNGTDLCGHLRANWSKKAMLAMGLVLALGPLLAQETGKMSSSYSPVVIQENFASVMSRMSAAKLAIMQRQKALLEERYDLSDRPAAGVTMSRGKAVQAGVRVKLRGGMNWERLAQMSPEDVREKDVLPLGFMPLPHPNHAEGGMLFPK